jgi:hypothetical protein
MGNDSSFLAQPFEKPPSPYEFRCQDSQPERYRQNTGPWRNQHRDAQQQHDDAGHKHNKALYLIEITGVFRCHFTHPPH